MATMVTHPDHRPPANRSSQDIISPPRPSACYFATLQGRGTPQTDGRWADLEDHTGDARAQGSTHASPVSVSLCGLQSPLGEGRAGVPRRLIPASVGGASCAEWPRAWPPGRESKLRLFGTRHE
jgi:hypothetical protein